MGGAGVRGAGVGGAGVRGLAYADMPGPCLGRKD